MLMWFFKRCWYFVVYSQSLHCFSDFIESLNICVLMVFFLLFMFSPCVIKCVIRLLRVPNNLLHWLQLNFFSWMCVEICCLSFAFVFVSYLHWVHFRCGSLWVLVPPNDFLHCKHLCVDSPLHLSLSVIFSEYQETNCASIHKIFFLTPWVLGWKSESVVCLHLAISQRNRCWR